MSLCGNRGVLVVVMVGVSSRCECGAGPRQLLVGLLCSPVRLLWECVVGFLSFMAAAVNMTGCLETICFQWLPHGNRELNPRSARCLSQR